MPTPPHWIVNAFGIGAALCSMASFLPQIAKLVREKDAEGVSLRMWIVTVTGFALWITYGFMAGAWPVAISNVINFALAATILFLALRIDKKS